MYGSYIYPASLFLLDISKDLFYEQYYTIVLNISRIPLKIVKQHKPDTPPTPLQPTCPFVLSKIWSKSYVGVCCEKNNKYVVVPLNSLGSLFNRDHLTKPPDLSLGEGQHGSGAAHALTNFSGRCLEFQWAFSLAWQNKDAVTCAQGHESIKVLKCACFIISYLYKSFSFILKLQILTKKNMSILNKDCRIYTHKLIVWYWLMLLFRWDVTQGTFTFISIIIRRSVQFCVAEIMIWSQ